MGEILSVLFELGVQHDGMSGGKFFVDIAAISTIINQLHGIVFVFNANIIHVVANVAKMHSFFLESGCCWLNKINKLKEGVVY